MSVALRILGNREMAMDAVQDMMKKLWENCEQLNVEVCGAAYACRAVRNRCLDILRLHKPITDVSVDSLPDDIVEPDDGVAAERMIELTAAIDRLDEPRKTILRLSLDGKSGAEIAKAVGISEPNVRQYLSRTRKELRKTILSNR